MLSDNVTELIQLVACNSQILLFFDASRVTIPGEENKIGQDFDIIEYFGTENLNFCPLVISNAPHNGLRSGNVRADTKFDAPYYAQNAYYAQFLLDEGYKTQDNAHDHARLSMGKMFYRQGSLEGALYSVCHRCFITVGTADDESELELQENEHECRGYPRFQDAPVLH